MAIKLHPSIVVHPGPWLRREIVDYYKLSIRRAAEHLGVTRYAMRNLLNGNAALSPEMAIRFEGVRHLGQHSDTDARGMELGAS